MPVLRANLLLQITQDFRRRGSTIDQITIEGDRRINLGGGVNSERLGFLLAALREMRRQHR